MNADSTKAFTIRSIVFGLLGILFICGLAGIHDGMISESPMIGNHLPVGAYLFFVLLALCWSFLFSPMPGLVLTGRRRFLVLSTIGGFYLFWAVFMLIRYAGAMMQQGIEAYPLGPGGIYAFVGFIIAVGIWNVICRINVPFLVLNPRELAVVLCMTLVSCFPPTSGLFRIFHKQLILPWHYLRSGAFTDWVKYDVLGYIPESLWPRPAPQVGTEGVPVLDATVYESFLTGMSRGNVTVGLSELPFEGWLPALMYWGPLILLCSICVMALSMVVHRQWVHHEQLSYPLAQVAGAFLKRERGKGIPDLFLTRLFWWGFLPIFLFLLIDYVHLWLPNRTPGLSEILPSARGFWLWNLAQKFPVLRVAPNWMTLGQQTLFFSIIGLSYFVAAEISLTVGVTHLLYCWFAIMFFSVTGGALASGDVEYARAGAYIGYAIILLFTGRAYYGAVFRKAFLMGGSSSTDRTAVQAARILVLAFAGFVVMLTTMGLDWMLAIVFALLLMLLFLVFTRIICETGIPFLQANWAPSSLMIALFGPAAIGPGAIVLLLYFNTIIAQDLRECLMPYAATALKVGEDAKVRIGKIFSVLVPTVIVALVVSFVASTWIHYNYGGLRGDTFSTRSIPTGCFNASVRSIRGLDETGVLAESASLSGLGKLKLLAPDGQQSGLFAGGLVCVVAVCLFRFRFARFPIHPVIFMLFGTYAAAQIWFSFLLGWAVKSLVVKFGGGKVYQKLKPLFIGLIAGELVAAGLAIMVELIYFWVVGQPSGKDFGLLPT